MTNKKKWNKIKFINYNLKYFRIKKLFLNESFKSFALRFFNAFPTQGIYFYIIKRFCAPRR